MTLPKQVVNKINYLKFIQYFFKIPNIIKIKSKFKRILNLNNRYKLIFLGRARTGIYLATKIIVDQSENKEVLIAPFTIPDVINLIKLAGGRPIFIDFEKKSTNLDIRVLKKNLINKPAALVITHYTINQKDYQKICKLCHNNNTRIIEDSAISVAGFVNKTKINSLSDFSIFSFSAFKFINFFYGGVISIKNKNDYKKISLIVSKWKTMSCNDYFKKFLEVLFFQILTNKIIFNIFTFRLIKVSKLLMRQHLSKSYTKFNYGYMNHTYFTKPSIICLNELEYKSVNFKLEQKHRRDISKIYYNYLHNISVPFDISLLQIEKSSCIHYLIYHEKSSIIREKLLKKNFDVGKVFYENCAKHFKNKSYSRTKNINDLTRKIIILPTHYKVNKDYAVKLSQEILNIINDIR